MGIEILGVLQSGKAYKWGIEQWPVARQVSVLPCNRHRQFLVFRIAQTGVPKHLKPSNGKGLQFDLRTEVVHVPGVPGQEKGIFYDGDLLVTLFQEKSCKVQFEAITEKGVLDACLVIVGILWAERYVPIIGGKGIEPPGPEPFCILCIDNGSIRGLVVQNNLWGKRIKGVFKNGELIGQAGRELWIPINRSIYETQSLNQGTPKFNFFDLILTFSFFIS